MPAEAASLETAEAITRASKSNLALAFVALPKERREDISLFYAFCRQVDDITDDPGFTAEQRATKLDAWRRGLRSEHTEEPRLAGAMRVLIEKYALPLEPFEEIIMGCEMDVAGAHYATWEALRLYCYRVASAVGLVSIEIFGARDPRRHEYATQLGLALQLTNILRDVGEDLTIGRIYLPSEEMARFDYSEADLRARRHNDAFVALMKFQTERAIGFYEDARRLLAPGDRRAAIAAEIMRAVYQRLLTKMMHGGFRVFERRYRVSSPGKLACIAETMLRTRLGFAPLAAPQR